MLALKQCLNQTPLLGPRTYIVFPLIPLAGHQTPLAGPHTSCLSANLFSLVSSETLKQQFKFFQGAPTPI